ncbi:serine hydrolase domain-containing protein [Prolixibacter denitrificans]|nr:serine hydrolase domain-containing protein [Prolixibacter denitrificans]PSK81500.1 CubicO group peptidase (beta-lactamase class C family) [Prolixibacter denitrificans]
MKKTKNRLLGVLILFLLAGCLPKENRTTQDTHLQVGKIDSLFTSRYQQDLFHGGVVISHNGKVIYENYLGIADRSWNIPVTKDVKFDIASLNKSMISALVLKAVEEGKLSLNDKLFDLLKDFSYEGIFDPKITLSNMLSHTSGLPDYDQIPEELRRNQFRKFKRMRFTNEEYVNFISKIKPVNEPGKQFYYSNFAYHLVAIILEETYHMPFSQILKEKLTRPLGLKHAVSVSKNDQIIKHLAKGYNYDEKTGKWLQNPFIDLSLGRRIFSTASDLNRWAQVMDNPGYLNKHSLELMKTNHLVGISKHVSYGYGWVVVDADNKSEMGNLGIEKPYIIHGGSTDGYRAMLININRGEYVISFLSNVGDRTGEMELAKQIVNLLTK